MRLSAASERLSAAALVALALVTPTIPWHAGPALLVLGALATRQPLFAALGAVLVWVPAADGPLGGAVLAAALIVVALRRDPLALVVVGVTLVLAAKQHAAARVLPAAMDVVPRLVVTGIVAAGAVATGQRGRAPAVGLAAAGLVVLARTGVLLAHPTVAAAERLHAVPLVYDRLLADPDARADLVRAAPDRDEAALALGWRAALDLGWRPHLADGVVVDVARELEARGRGGEARRLLARHHPREGEVDGLLALYERIQGEPVRWKGGVLGPRLDGALDLHLALMHGGYAAAEFTVPAAATLRIEGRGTSYQGPPVVEVWLDGAKARTWTLAGAGWLDLGPVDAGPHRLAFVFTNDLAGPDGDRNVEIVRVEVR